MTDHSNEWAEYGLGSGNKCDDCCPVPECDVCGRCPDHDDEYAGARVAMAEAVARVGGDAFRS